MHGLIFETSIWLLAGSTRFYQKSTKHLKIRTTSAQLCQTEFDEARLVEVETTTSTNLTFALATKMPTYANESSWYTLIQSTTTLTSYDATRFTVLLVCCENTLRLAYEYKSFVVSFEFRRIQNIASDVIALISGVTGATATTCSRIPATSQRNDANVRANPDFSSRNYWNHFSLHVNRTSHDRGLFIISTLYMLSILASITPRDWRNSDPLYQDKHVENHWKLWYHGSTDTYKNHGERNHK